MTKRTSLQNILNEWVMKSMNFSFTKKEEFNYVKLKVITSHRKLMLMKQRLKNWLQIRFKAKKVNLIRLNQERLLELILSLLMNYWVQVHSGKFISSRKFQMGLFMQWKYCQRKRLQRINWLDTLSPKEMLWLLLIIPSSYESIMHFKQHLSFS